MKSVRDKIGIIEIYVILKRRGKNACVSLCDKFEGLVLCLVKALEKTLDRDGFM